MQNWIGTRGDAFDVDLASRGMKQGEQIGRPVPGIFVRLLGRFSFRLPMLTRIGDGLIRACFILCPNGQPFLFG